MVVTGLHKPIIKKRSKLINMSVIKGIKKELLSASGPVVKKLHSNDNFKSIVIGFNKKSILKEHTALWPSKLTVMEGKVNFVQEDKNTLLNQYDTHDIEVGVLHHVEAEADSLCLLTQSRPNVT